MGKKEHAREMWKVAGFFIWVWIPETVHTQAFFTVSVKSCEKLTELILVSFANKNACVCISLGWPLCVLGSPSKTISSSIKYSLWFLNGWHSLFICEMLFADGAEMQGGPTRGHLLYLRNSPAPQKAKQDKTQAVPTLRPWIQRAGTEKCY